MLNQTEIECVNACNDCVAACLQYATDPLNKHSTSNMNGCIIQDMECANICKLLSTSIAHGDLSMLKICALCADICEKCASQCSQYYMSYFQECIDSCITCAKKCRELIRVSINHRT
jgi:hypothetical protein